MYGSGQPYIYTVLAILNLVALVNSQDAVCAFVWCVLLVPLFGAYDEMMCCRGTCVLTSSFQHVLANPR